MVMTSLEMLQFFGTGFERSQNGIQIGKQKDNLQLIALNYRQSFKCKLMQGLISWRIDTGTPKQYLYEAINVANLAVIDLKFLGSTNIAEDFYIEIASIISFVIDKPFEIPEYSPKGIVFDRLLNFELAQSLKGKNNEAVWLDIICKQKENKRINLCLLTYNIYRELLFNKDLNKTDELVKQAEEFFFKRKSDSYYIGGEVIEGGGPNNDVTVDYHLAAILKFISYEGKSMHKYRWN